MAVGGAAEGGGHQLPFQQVHDFIMAEGRQAFRSPHWPYPL